MPKNRACEYVHLDRLDMMMPKPSAGDWKSIQARGASGMDAWEMRVNGLPLAHSIYLCT